MKNMNLTWPIKIALGFTSVSILIISLVILTQDLHKLIGTYEHGELFQLLLFGTLVIINLFTIYNLFKNNKSKELSNNTHVAFALISSENIKFIGLKFVQGFLIGVSNKNYKE